MRKITGTIVSAKMQNTVVVKVESKKMHTKYKKAYKVSSKYHADTAGMDLAEGDIVIIRETRPMSKLKRWIVEEVITAAERDEVVEVTEEVSK